MANLLRIAGVFAALTGLILVLAGSLDGAEIVFALLCGLAGTVLAVALHRVAKKHFAFSVPLKAIVSPLAALFPETLQVGRALVAAALRGPTRQTGDFVRQPYDFGGEDERSTARRALTVIGVSMAPRSFVIRGERDALLLHGLPAKAPSSDVEWPA